MQKVYPLELNDDLNRHEVVLRVCSNMVEHFMANPKDQIEILVTRLNFIYPDYALMLLCAFKYLEAQGIIIMGRVKYNKRSTGLEYLCRINFFEGLSVKIPMSLKQISPHTLVKIQKYDEDNQIQVLESILEMLRNHGNMDDNVYVSLDYCLNEILDNVLLHSQVGHGWVVAQYFPNLNSIRLIVCDHGIGIKSALEATYNFTEQEALLKCVDDGITSGEGMGHGLFATSRFIELNQGWLSILSGRHKLDVTTGIKNVTEICNWQGTCVYLRINTNIDVDYKAFTGKHYDYKEHRFEQLFG